MPKVAWSMQIKAKEQNETAIRLPAKGRRRLWKKKARSFFAERGEGDKILKVARTFPLEPRKFRECHKTGPRKTDP